MEPSELVNYGVAGIVLGLFIAGLIVSKREHDRVIAERDRAWRQRDEIIDDVTRNVAPALEKATAAILSREQLEDLVIEVLVDVRRMLEMGDL